jgi:metallophosphoesterase (TIGR00282 family)
VWEKREFWPFLEDKDRVLRPINYPPENPGKGMLRREKPSPWGTVTWFALNIQGREFMPPLDCPFRAFDAFYSTFFKQKEKPVILVDFHAESSREKEAFAYYLDGRATTVAGTHTHVQTADERFLPKGTAYITDLGMTGSLDGVIGMDRKICMDRARNQVLYRMEVAAASDKDKTAVQGIILEIDWESGKAISIKRIPE